MSVQVNTFLENNLEMQQKGTLMFYKGIFSYPIIVELSQHIRNDLPFSPALREKIFSIFIELAQNVSSYSEEQVYTSSVRKNSGIGSFHLLENSQYIYLNTINSSQPDKINNIHKRVAIINTLDRKGLRELKMTYREQAIDAHTNSGNVGLIEVALKSGNIIHTHTASTDKEYISITTKLSKQ